MMKLYNPRYNAPVPGFALLLYVLVSISHPCLALNTPDISASVTSQLCNSLTFAHPVILDIRCGKWTPTLELEIRRVLLDCGVDVRETRIDKLDNEAEESFQDSLTTSSMTEGNLLSTLGLESADLLEVTLEQTFEAGEKRNLLSYSQFQRPVYRFILKQISLPEQRLIAIRDFSLRGEIELENTSSILALKWYEPIVASALISSLLIMLWTLK